MKKDDIINIVALIERKLNIISVFEKIKTLFAKETQENIVIVERDEFVKKMKEKFRGNKELLKAIEKCMNRNVQKHEYVSLTD